MTRQSLVTIIGACWLGAACGGAVVDDHQTPTETLEQDPARACDEVCRELVACPDKPSCGCSCLCAANAPDCVCPPCDCGGSGLQGCSSDCQETVDDTLAHDPQCEDQLVAVIDCTKVNGCSHETSCRSEEKAFEACHQHKKDGSITAPEPVGGGSMALPSPIAG